MSQFSVYETDKTASHYRSFTHQTKRSKRVASKLSMHNNQSRLGEYLKPQNMIKNLFGNRKKVQKNSKVMKHLRKTSLSKGF